MEGKICLAVRKKRRKACQRGRINSTRKNKEKENLLAATGKKRVFRKGSGLTWKRGNAVHSQDRRRKGPIYSLEREEKKKVCTLNGKNQDMGERSGQGTKGSLHMPENERGKRGGGVP